MPRIISEQWWIWTSSCGLTIVHTSFVATVVSFLRFLNSFQVSFFSMTCTQLGRFSSFSDWLCVSLSALLIYIPRMDVSLTFSLQQVPSYQTVLGWAVQQKRIDAFSYHSHWVAAYWMKKRSAAFINLTQLIRNTKIAALTSYKVLVVLETFSQVMKFITHLSCFSSRTLVQFLTELESSVLVMEKCPKAFGLIREPPNFGDSKTDLDAGSTFSS